MDEVVSQIGQFLSNTIIVRVYSYPPFAIEVFLASVVCVIHILLIFEVNSLAKRTNARAAARILLRQPIEDSEPCSFHSLVTMRTKIYSREPQLPSKSFYNPCKRFHRNVSRATNFGWMVSRRDSLIRVNTYSDRAEHLLSISPSEYVRRDKERKNREVGLRCCIQSLTSLLEKAIDNSGIETDNQSKEALRKSINAIKETLESRYSGEEVLTSSMQRLLSKKSTRTRLPLNRTFSSDDVDRSLHDDGDRNRDDKKSTIELSDECCTKSCDDMSTLFRSQDDGFYGDYMEKSTIALAN